MRRISCECKVRTDQPALNRQRIPSNGLRAPARCHWRQPFPRLNKRPSKKLDGRDSIGN